MQKGYPIILGRKPPTKEVLIGRTRTFKSGFDVLIKNAKYGEGTKRGSEEEPEEECAVMCWMHFVDLDALETFANVIIDYCRRQRSYEEDLW